MSILHSSVVHLTDLVKIVVARSIIGCAARHGNASRYKATFDYERAHMAANLVSDLPVD